MAQDKIVILKNILSLFHQTGKISMSNTNQPAKKVSKPFYKKWWFWLLIAIGISPYLFFAAFLGYQYIVQAPKAKEAQAQLEIEFKVISPFPNAKVEEYSSSRKTSQALVDANYTTEASFDDILKYYDAQLRPNGWQPNGITGLTDWGEDLGGKSAEYCKGDYVSHIQYAGEKAHYGWTYAFGMSWGLSGCEEKTK